MKKTLLLTIATLALQGACIKAKAETTAYALMSGYPTWSVCSYDFDKLGSTKAEKLFEVPFTDVQAAATVGECYYAYAVISDSETYIDNLVFASVNMETQETVVVKDFGDVWGEDGFVIRDMAYCNGTLYGIKDNNKWDASNDAMVYSTDIVEVDVKNGSFKILQNIEGTSWGITAKEGDLCLVCPTGMIEWSHLIDLFKVSDEGLTPLTQNEVVTCNEMAPSHAMTATDGSIYFFSGSTPYKMEGNVEVADAVTSYQQYTGTTFSRSTQSANPATGGDEKTQTRVLVATSFFGDYMGESDENKITSQKLYFYNRKMQPMALIETAANFGSTELYTQYYNPYEYDEQGNLSKVMRYQYGLYDFGDRAMHPAAGSVEYKYDEAGNCIEQIEGDNITTFEYDADGNCIKQVNYSNGKEGKTLEFSDFKAGKNKPALVVSSHTEESFTGEFYEESREYDAQGHLILTQRLCNRDYEEDHGIWKITTSAGDFMQEEHWTYDGRQLMLYEKFTKRDDETGELKPYLKTVYTIKDENTVGLQTYTAFSGEWYKSGVYQEEFYQEFAGMTSATEMELLSVERDEQGINDACLTFTLPMIANVNPNLLFDIYRNGELIKQLSLNSCLNGEGDLKLTDSGLLTYTDRDLPGGTYEYFIQTLTISDDDLDLLDEDDDDITVIPIQVISGYCASNRKSIDMTLPFELPAATDVYGYSSVKNDNGEYYVTVRFTAPEAPAEYGFISNELILGNAQMGEDVTTDPAKGELHCTTGSDRVNAFILTRYHFGKAISETITLEPEELSSIKQIMELGQEPTMVFDLNGHQLNSTLEDLHGNYIVVKGQKAYKVNLK